MQRARPELTRRIAFVTGGTFTSKSTDFPASVPNRVLPKPVDAAELGRVIQELMAAQGRTQR